MKLASLVQSLFAVALLAGAAVAQVNIQFSNQTSEPAEVTWVNGAERTHYMTLQPGETRDQQSFVGHQWSIASRTAAVNTTVRNDNQIITLGGYRPAPPVIPQFEPQPFQPQVPQVQPQPSVASLNQAVLNYAQSVVGRTIGNGQCTELAIEALQSAGAQSNQGYTWGTALRGVEDLQPGDVLQMHDARFEYPSGASAWSTGPHTAIVTSVQGSVIQVLEQNISGSPVQAGQYDARYLTAGRLEFYRPVAAAQQPVSFLVFGVPSNVPHGNGVQPSGVPSKIRIQNLPRMLPVNVLPRPYPANW